MQLTVVLPCYNEAANIPSTVRDVLDWFGADGIDGDIVAVDDGSSDGTGEVLDDLADGDDRIRVVRHAANRGYSSAVRSGCDQAAGEWVAFMDSDGQFRAADLNRLIEWTEEFDFVAGRRATRADPLKRHLFAKAYAIVVCLTLGIWIRDINCGMKLFRTSTWGRVRPQIASGGLFNAEVFYRLRLLGVPWKQVLVNHYPRAHGQQTGATARVIVTMVRELCRLRLARILRDGPGTPRRA